VPVGRNQILWVTWEGFGRGKPEDVRKRHLRRLMEALPGWVPDPADPSLLRPLTRAGRPLGPGGLRPAGVDGGRGVYDRNGGGFHNAAGTAILGDIGLTRGTPMGRLAGGGRPDGGGCGGAGGGGGGGGSDPVNPQIVRPGQPPPPAQQMDIVNLGAD
jgi:hypothetical protein